MSDVFGDARRLRTELAQLRAALHAVQAPPPDEAALRAAFREARQRRASVPPAAAPTPRRSRRYIGAAAAVVLVAVALGIVVTSVERPASGPATAAPPPPTQSLTVVGFQPLLNSPGLSTSASYSVVRVRIPLAAFALVPGTEQGGTIEADLLVGEDGLARGIRFDEADALLVSAR
jgi:hypothetical protein